MDFLTSVGRSLRGKYISEFTKCLLFTFFSTDVIDVVKDQLHGADYLREEDPRIYVSEKTGRGPLDENWVEDYWSECKVSYWLFAVKEHRAIRALRHDALLLWELNGLELMFYLQNKSMPTPSGKALMCAYKLCRVEFHYWGMQSKIEKFIHDVGKRRRRFIFRNVNINFIFMERCFVIQRYEKPCYELIDKHGLGRMNGLA